MSSLARLMWAIISHFAGGVSAKKLVKLVYFVDLRAAERLGHTISRASYTFHLFGPFPAGFFQARNELLGQYVTLSLLPDLDLDWHLHRPLVTCDLDVSYSEEEREVVAGVLRDLGGYGGWQLERLSKETEPMKQASRGDILGLTPADRQGIVWERAGIPVQRVEKQFRPLRFTEEQEARWAEQEGNMIRDLQPLRKRANRACILEELTKE